MSHAPGTPGSAAFDSSFASGVLALLEEFLEGGDPSDVLVQVTLVNAEEFFFKGLRVEMLTNVPGCVMLRGTESPAPEAVVIREDHILRAEFRRDPPPVVRFGF